nr:cyclin-dependent kinase 11B isoform X2 [Zonotrichia albicollis]
MRPWSRSPLRQQRDKLEQGESRKPVKEEKPEERDPLSDLQDISDSERKTSSAESSSESGSGSEEEEEESSSEGSEEEGEEEEEEEETGSNSEEVSEQSAEEVSEEEMSEEEERENGNHIPVVPESRFGWDSAGSEVEVNFPFWCQDFFFSPAALTLESKSENETQNENLGSLFSSILV